jgi:hypothetical protein
MAELTIKISEGEVRIMRTSTLIIVTIVCAVVVLKVLKGDPPKVNDKTYEQFLSDCTQELRPYECIALWRQGQG